jgi:hypothetical protein
VFQKKKDKEENVTEQDSNSKPEQKKQQKNMGALTGQKSVQLPN